ncbi:MAG: FliH/SctL family protein [Oscillospiraceae bacterium]
MLKIVRGFGTGYEIGEPVKIDNTVYIPSEDEDTGEFISAEEIRRREEEERAEQERRFNEAVDEKVRQILSERSAALEQERAGIIEQAKNQAASITADTKAATMAVMEKAQKECVILKEQAKKEGFEEGFAEGKGESLEKYKKYIDAAGKLLSEINSRKEAYYISNEEEMRETVFEMVKKIVRTEYDTNSEVIESIIEEAAKNFRNSDYIKITLAEDEITERFRTDEKLIKELIPFVPEIEIEFDEDAEEGTVILDNGSEIVDAGVPTQLDFLKEILHNTRGKTEDDE